MALPGGATDNDALDAVGNLVGDVLIVGVQVKLSVGKVRRLQSYGKGRVGDDASGWKLKGGRGRGVAPVRFVMPRDASPCKTYR